MSNNQFKNRIQIYLKEIHQTILQQIRDEKHWDESIPDREIILYSLVEYDCLKQENKLLKQKLNYIDQNIMITMNLVASMMKEMNLPQHQLESCPTYFEAKDYIQSLMNNPRTIRPTNQLKQTMAKENNMPSIDPDEHYDDVDHRSTIQSPMPSLQRDPQPVDQLKIMSDTFDEMLKNSGESFNA